ncbi:polyketide synthase [Xylaria grammica]|nr:polyketide synthase [Xylaria grammica]
MAPSIPNEPIAVIGSGCRFPGGINTPSKLWEQLKVPTDLQRPIPQSRFNIESFYNPDGSHPGRTNAKHAYTLSEDTHAFDAPFFNIQPHEAEAIDPQQRLLLETVYEGIASAGLKVEDLAGSPTAVYVGVMTHDFETNITRDLSGVPTHTATGISLCIASNRLSYFFDWHGPSMTLDTACSSSLVAVHLAVQHLRSGNGTIAVAAGANLILDPMPYVLESKLNMLSPTGRSRMWDAAADGYARGEGVACVILKTLSRALADGDQIECIIRETGVNQDGRTPGITMPNNEAQAALIRDTYSRAGLDLAKTSDRCQFFEAHGTGTPAGDPKEAEAISTAFLSHGQRGSSESPLYVGSIKTVIGHTEGTAGIAGLMKASLAVQHGIIPPNLLFEELSPRVAAFYDGLRIVKEAQRWPELAPGQPRRASVNSFGFGGTNAHAIIENYIPSGNGKLSLPAGQHQQDIPKPVSICTLPLVISAKSKRSMKSVMKDLVSFLKTNPGIQMQDVLWTHLKKRSTFNVRRAIVGARTQDEACAALDREIASFDAKEDQWVSTTDLSSKPGILGIFTGQGAQWPSMGQKLLATSALARETLAELDESLQTLPPEYRPGWKLYDEIMRPKDESNVMNASFSQPLCTAVQIMLVRMLDAVGINFTKVIGHSSGEIACAYAANFITAVQAIRIAYLRGAVVAKNSASPTRVKGAMLAAGASYEDALDLCGLEAFQGRVCVAAHNSPDSVTLSGDEDGILEIKEVLEDESKFARLLNVDMAYHSHHMLPCAPHYTHSMEVCGYSINDGNLVESSSPTWYSSVHEGKVMTPADTDQNYWKDNLVSPVLFSKALTCALGDDSKQIDVAIEVGPHPALKGPALSTMKAMTGNELPYTGCMQRWGDDADAFSGVLGFLWERFGSGFLDVPRPMDGESLAKALPLYPWDHSRSYWATSRRAHAFLQGGRPHLLLGKLSADSTASTLVWDNSIRPHDIEWLDGHGLQGQTVFPGAGYVIMAMEAAIHATSGRQVQLLEVMGLSIDKAITFEDEQSSVEISLKAQIIKPESSGTNTVVLSFGIDSCLSKESNMSSSASGQIVVTLGPTVSSGTHLPPAREELPHMNKVNLDTFYKELSGIGYQYTKDFREILSLKRTDGKTTGSISFPQCPDGDGALILHPATLDLTFQTIIAAYSSPGDKRLRSLHVPTNIDRIAIVPSLCATLYEQGIDKIHFNSSTRVPTSNAIRGDIEAFTTADGSMPGGERTTLFQVEGITFKPFTPPSAADDHRMFSKWAWGPLAPRSLLDNEAYWATAEDKTVMPIMERAVYFYIRDFLEQLTKEDRQHVSPHHEQQIKWFEYISAEAKEGRLHSWYDVSWEADTHVTIAQMCERYSYHPHDRLIRRIGENLTDIITYGTRNPFELMDHDGLLTDFYADPHSSGPSLSYFEDLVTDITHRYQNMDILEIGAGTGGATKHVLNSKHHTINSYTFTDLSSSLLDKARDSFAENETRIEFRRLDICQKPEEQGFTPQGYDMVIASNVLHATPRLEETMANVRSLLKPGGQLVIVELTHRKHSRLGFIFGLFPEWWAGQGEGRTWEPFVSMDEWNGILKRTGFSGIDSRTSDRDAALFPNSCFSTHAVNSRVMQLDNPLSVPAKDENSPAVVVIGGATSRTKPMIERLQEILPRRRFVHIQYLRDIHETDLEPNSSFLVLSELDDALFLDLDPDKFEAIKVILHYASNLLFVTENAWVQHPQQAMVIGLLRSLRLENPGVSMQVLDADCLENVSIETLAEQLLRLEYGAGWQESGLVWTQEPEIYLSNGRLMIPRLRHDAERNARLNATRRPILADVNLNDSPVILRQTPHGVHLECSSVKGEPSAVEIRVRFALAKSIYVTKLGFLYLTQGMDTSSGKSVIALSQENGSTICVPASHVFDLNSTNNDQCVLLHLAAELTAQNIMSHVSSGAAVLILEPPEFCVEALVRAAKSKAAIVKLATMQPARLDTVRGRETQWILLHEKETHSVIESKLSASSVSHFYDFSADQGPFSLGRRLATCLPPTCLVHGTERLFQDLATQTIYDEDTSAQRGLVDYSLATVTNDPTISPSIIPADQVVGSEGPWDISTVINWHSDQTLTARIRPVDATDLFTSTKTYILVGLAGDLGRSLARWMIKHGARHIVLSSRNPQVDDRWLEETRKTGGNVLVLPMDVSDKPSVDAGLAKISASGMPIIGGVAFGPLVLQDILFKNMDLEMMEMVLAPKVTGATILNEALAHTALDFFVMFSSVVAVLGNPGQTAYSAANSYMHGLAQQRRARGLAGSTIDIGAVYGVGYVTRAGREEEFDAVRFLFDTVSEDELHALFAEAVIAGQPGTPLTQDVEVITGVPFINPVYRERIPFFDDPRFGYYLLKSEESQGEVSGAASNGTIKEQLAKAESMDKVREIVANGLSLKLRSTLQTAAEDSIDVTSSLIDQGVDSLGAVTIGTWFSKQLNLDLPLLKVLGGASITDLATEAATRLPPSAIPLVLSTSSADSEDTSSAEEHVPSSDETTTDSLGGSKSSAVSSVTESDDENDEAKELMLVRREKLSLTQEYSWAIQKQVQDPSILNSTIGMFMEGPIDFSLLAKAVNAVLRRHDIFRTRFHESANGPTQDVMSLPSPLVQLQNIPVANRAAALEGFTQLEQQKYAHDEGDTTRFIIYHWSSEHHLLVLGYSRFVGDGQTTENIFNEIGQYYAGASVPSPAQQYADFTVRQLRDYESGRMDEDIDFWVSLHKSPVPVLPMLALPQAQPRGAATDGRVWGQHTASVRLNPMIAIRIKERSRKHKAAPMHFYLTAFHVLLARLTSTADVAIGFADTNRHNLQDMTTMGYFANLLPVRMAYAPGDTFGDELVATKDFLRGALPHSQVPYGVVLERLGLASPPAQEELAAAAAPLFQAVFDYRQGQAESGSIGAAKITEVVASRERTPHDVVLEISDDPTKTPLITFKLKDAMYGPDDVQYITNAYLAVLSVFSRNPALKVNEGRLDQTAKGVAG